MNTMRSRPYYYPYHMDKWRVRKIRGAWYIYEPNDALASWWFNTFPYGWKPGD